MWIISIGGVSIYLLIAVWIAFCVIFLWIIYFLFTRQFIKSIYPLCQHVQINSPLSRHACNLSLGWWNGAMVKCLNGIYGHMIGVTSGVTFFLFRFCHDSADCLLNFLVGQWYIVEIIVIDWRFQHLRIVLLFWGCHAHLFIRHIKSIQKLSLTFEYVKISRNIIFNWRFLILCLIRCVFFIITHSCLGSSVEHSLTMMPFDSDLLSSVEHLSTIMPFDSSFSAEQLCDKVCQLGTLLICSKRTRSEYGLYKLSTFLRDKRASWGYQLSSYTL